MQLYRNSALIAEVGVIRKDGPDAILRWEIWRSTEGCPQIYKLFKLQAANLIDRRSQSCYTAFSTRG